MLVDAVVGCDVFGVVCVVESVMTSGEVGWAGFCDVRRVFVGEGARILKNESSLPCGFVRRAFLKPVVQA